MGYHLERCHAHELAFELPAKGRPWLVLSEELVGRLGVDPFGVEE